MPRDYDSDKPKKSWREIDRSKDSSRHRQEDRPGFGSRQKARAESASKAYKSKLDAFFDGEGAAPAHVKDKLSALEKTQSGQGKERLDALVAIKDASTSSAADKATGVYLESWELPPDFDVLAQVLTCSEESYVERAMDMIAEMFKSRRVPKRAAVLEQRLRRVKTLSEEPSLQKKADELIRELRLFS